MARISMRTPLDHVEVPNMMEVRPLGSAGKVIEAVRVKFTL